MLYSEQMKEICDKLGVDRSECKDGLYSTFLQAISDACDNAGGGGVAIKNQDKTITENGTYKADSGYTGLGTVSVNVPSEEPVLQEKTATENGTVQPDTGYDGLSKVVVDVPGIVPSGTIDITENGSYDVTNFATALVEIAASGGGGNVFACGTVTCTEQIDLSHGKKLKVTHNLGFTPTVLVMASAPDNTLNLTQAVYVVVTPSECYATCAYKDTLGQCYRASNFGDTHLSSYAGADEREIFLDYGKGWATNLNIAAGNEVFWLVG